MKLDFADWLKTNEVSTHTGNIAAFQRPVMGLVRRMWMPSALGVWGEEDPFFRKKKKHFHEGELGGDMSDMRRVREDAIKINLPSVQQPNDYSCGAAIVQSICSYFGVGLDTYDEYVERLGTNQKEGTNHEHIIDLLKERGLNAKMVQNMEIADIHALMDEGKPVICLLQAYGPKKKYKKSLSGHYVAAIGYDKNCVYFEDPSSVGHRAFLPNDDFIERWHDLGNSQEKFVRTGIVVWKRGVKKPAIKTKFMY